MERLRVHVPVTIGAILMVALVASAQEQGQQASARPAAGAPVVPGAIVPPPGYVIGADDVLAVTFWREKDLSSDVAVRPDGKITLPLLNDIEAAGLTPDQLRDRVTKAAGQYVEDPNVTVTVKAINSRKVFITGNISKPGPYPLGGPMTVMQLIAMAGGVQEFAKSDRILIMRTENGKPAALKFNYKEVADGKKLTQNIELLPGDTVIVP
jgi:polysaccharide export outer membrane protein